MDAKEVSTHEVESMGSDKASRPHANAGEVVLISHGEVRRIPIPTNDPNDPLNMNKWRKAGVLLTCCWFCELIADTSLSPLSTDEISGVFITHDLWYWYIHELPLRDVWCYSDT